MADKKPLIIVGASARAAAQAATRSGFSPWCVDQFGDADLRKCAMHTEVVPDWPEGISQALTAAPDAPLVIAGALENSLDLVAELSGRFQFAGASADSMRLVRDPFWLQDCLRTAGLATLDVRGELTGRESGKSWLSKPLSSAAGFHVRRISPPAIASRSAVFQEFAQGRTLSGLYIAFEGGCFLFGMSQQLQGVADSGADGFLHCGSIGPLRQHHLGDEGIRQAREAGQVIATRAGLRGLFGVDFVLSPDGRKLWTLEVNPRWTASVELFERAIPSWPLMLWHVDATRPPNRNVIVSPTGSVDSMVEAELRQDAPVHGRIVIYSPVRFRAHDRFWESALGDSIEVADIPVNGTVIQPGHPVCTLLLQADSPDQCRQKLSAAARRLRSRLTDAAIDR